MKPNISENMEQKDCKCVKFTVFTIALRKGLCAINSLLMYPIFRLLSNIAN